MGIIINGLTDTVTAADGSLNIGGDVTIPGELSYDDVTNIDSVGIVTSRNIIFSGSTGTPGQFVLRRDSDGANIGQFRSDAGTDDISIGNGGSGSLIFKTGANTERLRITSDGKIVTSGGAAVGTVTLAGDGKDMVFGRTQNSGTGGVGRLVATGNIVYLQAGANASSGSAADLVFGNYGGVGERVRITSDGRLLLGTADAGGNNTANHLVVSNNAGANDQAGMTIRGGTSGRSQIFFSDGTSGQDEYRGMLRYDHQDNSMQFRTNAVEKLRITSGGNLGIGGLTNPGALLSIPAGESNTPRFAIESAVDDNDFTITQYEDGNGTYTMLGQNVKLNSGGNNTILDSGHRTAGILLDARNHGAITFLTGGANAVGENVKITSGGDVLIGGQSAYTYDDTGDSNTILDIWNSGNNKRGILSLSGQTNGGSSIGTIWFNNDNNAGTGPAANMKLSAAIQAQAVTSDSNAGNDAGARLQFFTKPEAGSMSESLLITSDGDLYQRTQRVHTCLHAEYRHLTGSVSTDSVGSFVDIKNFGYTPKRAGSLIVCHFQVQTWNGSQSNMSGDIYFRARFDQGTGTYVNVTYGGNNNRLTGNFDQDSTRQHLYYTHTFGFIAQNTNQHTINLQASNTTSLSTNFNWFHTGDNANGCWIFEYDN